MRSLLFVPADSEKKLAKGAGSGADALILDLEDAVAAANKPDARRIAATFLARHARPRTQHLYVRINPLDSGLALTDLAAIMPSIPDGIVIPKPNSAADLITLGHYLSALEAAHGIEQGSTLILPVATETPASVFGLGSYAAGVPRLMGITWGAEDLPAAIGASVSRWPDGGYTDLCRLVRSLALAAAAAAGVAPIETVYPAFRDLDGLNAYATRGRAEGFTGMMAIHPDQVPVINAAFTPSDSEIAHARQIVDLFARNPDAGTLALDGKMLDMPHLVQARRILAQSQGIIPNLGK